MFTFLCFGLSIFLNTEQYSLSSCNMISRAEVKNIIDKLQGVKISLLRMASEAVLNTSIFLKLKLLVSSILFYVRITLKAVKLFYFPGVVYCSLNSTIQVPCFLNLSGLQNPLESELHSPLAPTQPVSQGSGVGPGICTFLDSSPITQALQR